MIGLAILGSEYGSLEESFELFFSVEGTKGLGGMVILEWLLSSRNDEESSSEDEE
ncbi:MAG: hypothetical protein K6G74_04870 [Bacilli bacterium]|nr:hypothetical protein [Bacilli bacterium]